MTRAIEACFRIESDRPEPYFYRHLARQPATADRALQITQQMFDREQGLIESDEIKPLVWRLAARAFSAGQCNDGVN